MPTMRSLAETLDMPSQRLARPAHPVRLAYALQAMALGTLVWTIATIAPLSGRVAAAVVGAAPSDAIKLADQWAAAIAFIGALLVAVGFFQLARRDDRVLACEMGRAGRWMVFGGGMWVVGCAIHFVAFAFRLEATVGMAAPGISFACLAVEIIGGSIAAIGVRRVLGVLGQRCRRYRVAAHAQQSTEALAIAAALFLVTALAARILPSLGYEMLALSASVVAITSAAVLTLGVLYLVANCWWIARALVAPPPALSTVVHVRRDEDPGESIN